MGVPDKRRTRQVRVTGREETITARGQERKEAAERGSGNKR